MTLVPNRIRSESVELKNSSATTIIIIGIIMVAVLVSFSVIPALTSTSTGHYRDISQIKRALCTSKILGLALKGEIRDAAGYYGGLSECMAMKSTGSIYGEAGAAQ